MLASVLSWYGSEWSGAIKIGAVAVGAVLEQERGGETRPVAYFSRKLLPRERSYPITELEALAIVDAIEHFAVYLAASKFTVVTDHRALTYFNKMNNRSIRLTRWSHTLQPYDCVFKYRKGKENQVADYLSRASDQMTEDKDGDKGSRGRLHLEEGGCVGPAPPTTADPTSHTHYNSQNQAGGGDRMRI